MSTSMYWIVWQNGREGFRLGTLSDRGRDWLRVMIYVPDELEEETASVEYFRDTPGTLSQPRPRSDSAHADQTGQLPC